MIDRRTYLVGQLLIARFNTGATRLQLIGEADCIIAEMDKAKEQCNHQITRSFHDIDEIMKVCLDCRRIIE